MIIMPSNNTGFIAGSVYGRFPDRIAHLHNIDRWVTPPIRFAVDNGVFGCYTTGREWDEINWRKQLAKAAPYKPMWTVVPDWVGNKELTLERWGIFAPEVKLLRIPLAFAAQDGMTPDDVPEDAEIVFVGGTTEWKWKNILMWTKNFKRVHVGRVNSYGLLWKAHEAGAESCDGTGWFREPSRTRELVSYLEESTEGRYQQRLFDDK
jgi:hypothetical protein